MAQAHRKIKRQSNPLFKILLFILILSLPGIGVAQEKDTSLLKEGLRFYLQAKYRLALGKFAQSVKEKPSDIKSNYYLGLTNTKLKRYKEAVDWFLKTLELDPVHQGARFNLGISYFKLKNYDQAAKELNWVLQKVPGHSPAHFFMGLTLSEQGNQPEAISNFKKAQKLDSKLTQLAQYNMGLSYLKAGESKQARLSFSRAIEKKPESNIANQARRFIEAIDKKTVEKEGLAKAPSPPPTPKIAPKKRLQVSFDAAWEYSDNVTQSATDTQVGENDISSNFDFSGQFNVLDRAKSQIYFGYDLSQTLYDKITDLNFQSHTATIGGSHDFGSIELGLDYNFAFVQLGGNDFTANHTVTPNAGFFIGDSVFVFSSYSFTDKRFISDSARTGTNHSLGFDIFKFFLNARGYVKMGYRGSHEDTRSSEFDYFGQILSGGIQLPLPLKFKINLGYRYTLNDYKNITESIAEEREDTRHNYNVTLSRKFFDHFRLNVNWSHNEVISNLLSVDSKENIVNIGVGFYY